MIKLTIPLRARPKLRGHIGRHGNMTHKVKWYVDYRNEFSRLLEPVKAPQPYQIHSLGISFTFTPKGGRKPDLDNLSGSVLDCLVESKIISDDNWGVVPMMCLEAKKGASDTISIYLMKNMNEYLYVIKNFFGKS